MEEFSRVDIFDTKGIEYLFVIAYLLFLIIFWNVAKNPQRIIYCAFRVRNKEVVRRSLNMEEIATETRVLIEQGHKRVLLVGGESYPKQGFRYILDGLNAERILIAAECIGDGYWFIDRATGYAKERIVFDRPIGQNQGIQFPIAQAYINIRAADLMRIEAARLFDNGQPCGAEANMSKLLAADASWEAANVTMQTFGGFGFAKEYDVERKFRETRLYQIAPISTNLILSYIGQHILGMPRSF